LIFLYMICALGTELFRKIMPPKKKAKMASGYGGDSRAKNESGEVVKSNSDGSETFTLFYGNTTAFSNFCPSKFVIDGKEFNCTEQYFHYMKAVQFKDDDIASKILKSESPGGQKALGRKVKNYDQKVWDEVGPRAMKQGLKAKFAQNPDLKSALLKSAGTTLVEASPRDRKWGIGLGVHNPKAADRSAWRGRNLLGKLLMEVRDELMKTDGEAGGEGASSSSATTTS